MHRFGHPLISLLPDLSNTPVRRQVVGAMIASVVLHFVILFGIILASGLLPTPRLDFARTKPKVQELELVLPVLDPPEMQIVRPEDLLRPRPERETIDSTGLAKSEEKPKDAIFESDQDMKAASEQPGTGAAPLPTVAGKDLPFRNFTTQDVSLGSPKIAPSPEPVVAEKPLPRTPIFKPQPIPRDQASAQSSTPDKPLPKPAVTPSESAKATPPPLPEVKVPSETQIALGEKAKTTPGPVPRVVPPPIRPHPVPVPPAAKDTPQEMAKLVTPAPSPQPVTQPGFRAEQEQTRIEGSITNKGRAAVDAVKTPLGVYKRQVNAAIGSRWYYYVSQRRDMIAFGSVKVTYAITADGKIVDVKVASNTSNETLANICQQSIREAEIGPPPEEAQAAMNRDRLEFDLTFTYYDQY